MVAIERNIVSTNHFPWVKVHGEINSHINRLKWRFASKFWVGHFIPLHTIVFYLHFMTFHLIAFHCIPLHFITYHCISSHSIALQYIPLYLIISYFIPFERFILFYFWKHDDERAISCYAERDISFHTERTIHSMPKGLFY